MKSVRLFLMLMVVPFIHVFLSIILVAATTGCAAHLEVTVTSPDAATSTKVVADTARRTMIAVDNGQVTVITGQVAINDETVQALGREATKIIYPPE